MIESFVFGHLDGAEVRGFILRNRSGMSAKLIAYGARLTEMHAPDRAGRLADVVLGFDDVASYVATDTYFGATCGRYGNRIREGRFRLGGEEFQVSRNEGRNHLHGGFAGFDRKIWEATTDEAANSVTFTTTSPHGEEGYPGNVQVSATYRLTDDDRLEVAMRGTTDRLTVLNMVHHSYWNLAGHGSGHVRDQVLMLNSDFYTPIDAELMTTGEVLAVTGTIFDYREPKAIGADIDALSNVGTGHLVGGGYDHNWCLRGGDGGMRLCARVVDPASGRGLELHTTEPGVQFYTGGYLNEKVIGKGRTPYCRFAGYTFETQTFPDTPNFAHFPGAILRPDEVYDHRMSIRFFAQ